MKKFIVLCSVFALGATNEDEQLTDKEILDRLENLEYTLEEKYMNSIMTILAKELTDKEGNVLKEEEITEEQSKAWAT